MQPITHLVYPPFRAIAVSEVRDLVYMVPKSVVYHVRVTPHFLRRGSVCQMTTTRPRYFLHLLHMLHLLSTNTVCGNASPPS